MSALPGVIMNLYERIPNNVNLDEDKKLQRALEKWLPNYLDWWQEMGPDGFQQKDVYLRTAISVEPDGWANFDFVKMPDYRWGIFLKPAAPEDWLRRQLRPAGVPGSAGRIPQLTASHHSHAG
jgi:hypothetical protein